MANSIMSHIFFLPAEIRSLHHNIKLETSTASGNYVIKQLLAEGV